MKKIFALVFSIWLINVIGAIVVLEKDVSIEHGKTVAELYNGFKEEENIRSRMFRFMRDITKDNDFEIHYSIASGGISSKGVVRFCQADVSTLDGTVAEITAKSLGLDIMSGIPCPVAEGTVVSQSKVFSMETRNSNALFDNGESSSQLSIIVDDTDWTMDLEVFTDEAGAELLRSFLSKEKKQKASDAAEEEWFKQR